MWVILKQVANLNFNQSIGIQLNIPILNGRQLKTNYERAQLDLENSKLQLRADNLTLQSKYLYGLQQFSCSNGKI